MDKRTMPSNFEDEKSTCSNRKKSLKKIKNRKLFLGILVYIYAHVYH